MALPHKIVSHTDWIAARKALLDKEKEFTRARDALSALRREMPWEKVEKRYAFSGLDGATDLPGLFKGRGQLIVYHFMLGPDWEEGCKSCSFWADNFDGVDIHLAHRDTSLALVSQAPLDKIEAYRQRMGWTLPWYSSFGSDFNFDYQVSFSSQQLAAGPVDYNYEKRQTSMTELPGVSVFAKDADGGVFHTYSCYARGLDMLNGAYHLLDLTPKGRDEAGLPFPMAWVHRRDQYGT